MGIPTITEEPRYILDSAKETVGILLDTLMAHGMREVVCSPGSRNTPLLIAASVRSKLRTTVIVDERTAAFVALGKAIVSKLPVGLICTSGSAILNYAPALAEAFYQNIPLIAITADRPLEWIDQDDSQTIHQFEAFRNFTRGNYDIISGRCDNDYLWYVNRIANEGMGRALGHQPGPVHFNIRLDNPLNLSVPYHERSIRKVTAISAQNLLAKDISNLAATAIGKKILIVAGFNQPDFRLDKAIKKMLALPNVTIMAESVSNLHVGKEFNMVDSLLSHMDDDAKRDMCPDILITMGGSIVSRKLKEWLRTFSPSMHWSLSQNEVLADCYKCVTDKIECPPQIFLSSIAAAISKMKENTDTVPQYAAAFTNLRKIAAASNSSFLQNAPWSDLKAFDITLNNIPEKANLFLSNGTSIRYAQILNGNTPHASFCNRGVSGIDGCTSTAVGASTVYSGLTVLITGDMSFSYDIGALGCRLADERMRIIVVNNGGGGIFRFIPSTKDIPQLEEFFCADSAPPVKGLAAAYGWEYLYAENETQLKEALSAFFRNDKDRAALLEIKTPPTLSAKILTSYLNPKNRYIQ
ncbi:MAG: 2-succinyl-5-enolpyruvyl-6-hydroxy-3-cyclohexene-1-carboxylic-acid synthase [Muribaculum sp.]|nr:2-succinyl-5-enolpyruvyl-6-hydroxy-3-cyclohexene-1-carboxylic-acid synthase [Muribaculum sp.]